MKLTSASKYILRQRRGRRKLIADGYEEIGENGGKLWELHRGHRIGHIITEVAIGPDGRSLWIKTCPDAAYAEARRKALTIHEVSQGGDNG